MFKRCPADVLASSHAHNACVDAAPDTALHDPARDAKPVGTRCCKNACTNVHGEAQKTHNNPGEHTAGSQNFPPLALGAGPRTALLRQLTLLGRAHPVVADTVAIVPGGVGVPFRWRDIAGLPSVVATAWPPADTLRCNNGFAAAAARTAVRIL